MIEITNEKSLKDSYEKIWIRSDLKEEQSYYHWILNLLNADISNKLLDVACGGGYLLNEAELDGLECYGIDISINAIKKTKKIINKSKLILASAESIPFKNGFFDHITCLGSLEHFMNPDKSLEEMGRVLKDTGKICIVLPNIWHIPDVLRGWFYGEGLSHGQESERFYSLNEAKALIEKHSIFKIDHIDKYNQPQPKPMQRFNKYYTILYKLFMDKIPVTGSYVFVFICTKRYLDALSSIQIGNFEHERYLGQGWHSIENWPPAIRWTENKAIAYLKNNDNYKFIKITFFSKSSLDINIYINNRIIKKIKSEKDAWQTIEGEIGYDIFLEIKIELDRNCIPEKNLNIGDNRELMIAVHKIWLE